MTAYYNEIDSHAAQTLRELIEMGVIAPGVVDERSIIDVTPEDLRGFTQCHFFAGIGVWSYALRLAGWSDDRPVWTGSCPCQPFSQAGTGDGVLDDRHLWPAWHRLIDACKPITIFGEQVASAAAIGRVGRKDGDRPEGSNQWVWIDHVQHDLEASSYAVSTAAFAAASVGAPHQRLRTYVVAHRTGSGCEGWPGLCHHGTGGQWRHEPAHHGSSGKLGDSQRTGLEGQPRHVNGTGRAQCGSGGPAAPSGPRTGTLADDGDARPGPVNGFWSGCDWIWCRDERWRPIESGLEPLADGSAERLGHGDDTGRQSAEARSARLKGYGNAIVAQQAAVWVQCAMEAIT